VLFDTAQSGPVWLRNLKLLDVEPATIDAVAISHAHYGHTGGLLALLGHLRPGIPLYANPDLFRGRFAQSEGRQKNVGLSLTREELAASLTLQLSAAPQKVLLGLWTTGDISERPEAEGSSDYHLMGEGEDLVVDAYQDDMALSLELGDRLVLLCGFCHAGLLNTLAHVERVFERPISVIGGGLHLTRASDDDLRRIGDMPAAMPALQRVYANHYSGERAFAALTQILGPSVVHPHSVVTIWES
jgi:7,8-dihydropterin-6-yl-methyl-4-(beta-D-ribofuranosyl)aminobenzene 5'-phosphate synthase